MLPIRLLLEFLLFESAWPGFMSIPYCLLSDYAKSSYAMGKLPQVMTR